MASLATQGTTIQNITSHDGYMYVWSDGGLDIYDETTWESHAFVTLANTTCGAANDYGIYIGTSDAGIYHMAFPAEGDATTDAVVAFSTTTTPAISGNNVTGIAVYDTKVMITTTAGADFYTGTSMYTYTGTLTNGFLLPAITSSRIAYAVPPVDGDGVHISTSHFSADWDDGDIDWSFDFVPVNETFTSTPTGWTESSGSTASVTYSGTGAFIEVGPSATVLESISLQYDAEFIDDAVFDVEFDWEDWTPAAGGATGQAAYFQARTDAGRVLCDAIVITLTGGTRRYYFNYRDSSDVNQSDFTSRAAVDGTSGSGTIYLSRRYNAGVPQIRIQINDSSGGGLTTIQDWVNSYVVGSSETIHFRVYLYSQPSLAQVSFDLVRFQIMSLTSYSSSPVTVTGAGDGFFLADNVSNYIGASASDIFICSANGVVITPDFSARTHLSTELGSAYSIAHLDIDPTATASTGAFAFTGSGGMGIYDINGDSISSEAATISTRILRSTDGNYIIHDG